MPGAELPHRGGRALLVHAADAEQAAALLAEAEARAGTEADTLPDFADYEDPETPV